MTRNIKIVATLILSALTILGLCIFSFADPPGPPAQTTITGTPSPTATVGTAYNFTPSSTNTTSFSYTGTLPPGLSFIASSGSVSGTPTTVGTYSNIVITAANITYSSSLPAFSIAVAASGGTGGGGDTGGGSGGTKVPVMEGLWLFPGILAGVGLLARRRKA